MANRLTSGPWRRVDHRHRCPICQKDSWCCITEAGDVVLCMRTESQSACRNGGWLHRLTDSVARDALPPAAGKRPTEDAAALHRRYLRDMTMACRKRAARELGVTSAALALLETGWRRARGGALTFPMRDEAGHVIGIRIRAADWKGTAKGTRNGIFLPAEPVPGRRVVLAEGPTDTAALLSIRPCGSRTAIIGRPGCNGGAGLVTRWAEANRVIAAAIVADRDGPGQHGADRLARRLASCVADVRVIVPPCPHKDVRDWVRAGATWADVVRRICDANRIG